MSAVEDTVQFVRPEGMHPDRWERIKSELHLLVTGHAPWCEMHEEDMDYCRAGFRGACIDVGISNGTTDGSTVIAYALTNGAHESELTIGEALCISAVLEQAGETAKRGMLTGGRHAADVREERSMGTH